MSYKSYDQCDRCFKEFPHDPSDLNKNLGQVRLIPPGAKPKFLGMSYRTYEGQVEKDYCGDCYKIVTAGLDV